MEKKRANVYSDDDGTTYLLCHWEQNKADKVKIFKSTEECVTYCEENDITAVFLVTAKRQRIIATHPNKYSAEIVIINKLIDDRFDFNRNIDELSFEERITLSIYANEAKYEGARTRIMTLAGRFFEHLQEIYRYYLATENSPKEVTIKTDQEEGVHIIEVTVTKHTPITENKDILPDTVKSVNTAHTNINDMLDHLDRMLTAKVISKPNYNAVVNRLLLSREILDEVHNFIKTE